MAKVRIVRKPQQMQIGGSPLFNAPGMADKSLGYPIMDPLHGMAEETSVNESVKAVPRSEATLEAEGGETVVTDLAKIGIPQHFSINGKRHYEGGIPLNLPGDSFVFSRDKSMKIYDKDVLAQFGKNIRKGKRGFTPADIAKQYKNNKYLKILMDPDSDKLSRDTAEMMIQNYNLKLGALAMVQESKKGFEDGIPAISMDYMERLGLTPEQLVSGGQQEQQQAPMELPEMMTGMQMGGSTKRRVRIKKMGGTPKYQRGGQPRVGESYVDFMERQGSPVNGWGRSDSRTWNGTTWSRSNPTDNPVEVGGKIVPSTSNKTTSRQNIPNDAVKWDMTADGYDESQVQPGDYIKKEDGKWYKATGYTQKNYGYEDSRLGELQSSYGHLQNTLTNNPDLQDAVYTNYQKHITDSDLPKDEKERLLQMPRDQVINTFLQGQKQVYAINNAGLLYEKNEDGTIKYDASNKPIMKSEKDLKVWETSGSEEYNKQMKGLGFEDDEIFSPEMTAVFQATYRGLEDASLDERFTETLANFNITPVGLKDSHGLHTYDDKPISPVDNIFGNTTAGQAVLPKELDKDLSTAEVDWVNDDPEKPVQGLDIPPEFQEDAPWWLQDVVKTSGAAADRFRIKRHAPWQATPDTFLPDPTFFDPTRELAANAELANIATAGAAMFSGPQALGARSAAIQGQAAQNAANILSQYNQKNVSTANQFEMQKAQIMNQASRERSQLATQLYDKNTIANQQFENSKNQARENQRQSYIDALTNRAQTQALNELYPQYDVDPVTGGFLEFDKGRALDPTVSNAKTISDNFARIKRENPGIQDQVAYKLAANEVGTPDTTPFGAEQAYYGNYLGQMQG